MKEITQYKAFDGTVFGTAVQCVKYEGLCNDIKAIMDTLPSKPEGTDFANGSGFIQHDGPTLLYARKHLLKLAMQYSSNPSLQQAIDEGIRVGPSVAGRIIDDCCPRPLKRAWYRIMNTAADFREFGQCYFRLHPTKAAQVCLNPSPPPCGKV